MRLWQSLSVLFLILMLAFTAGLFVLLGKKKEIGPVRLFLPCVLSWGVLYSLVFIPFSAPDEYAHFASAYRLSNQLLWQEACNEAGQVLVREDDARLLWPELSVETYEEVYGDFWTLDHSQEKIGYGHEPMGVAFHAYLPQALGITLGRLLGLGQVLTVYLGRLCNLLFFAFCGYYAVRLAPFGKMAFFGTAMLPMTLELASSLSYDAFAIGLGMLFTAYALHLAYEAPQVGRRELAVLAVLLTLLAPCKMVYIPLAGLCFLIPREKFGLGRKYLLGALAVAGCMAAGVMFVNMDKISVYLQGTEDPIAWAGDAAGYSFASVLADPLPALRTIANTLARRLPGYAASMVGSNLGWLEHEIDSTLILFLMVWTGLTALPVRVVRDDGLSVRAAGGSPMGAARDGGLPEGTVQGGGKTENVIPDGGPLAGVMPMGQRIFSLVLCFGTLLATLFIMLLSWTPLSSPVVEGVQGRYFLPVLPLSLLALRGKRLSLEQPVDTVLVGGYCAVELLVLQSILGRV